MYNHLKSKKTMKAYIKPACEISEVKFESQLMITSNRGIGTPGSANDADARGRRRSGWDVDW